MNFYHIRGLPSHFRVISTGIGFGGFGQIGAKDEWEVSLHTLSINKLRKPVPEREAFCCIRKWKKREY